RPSRRSRLSRVIAVAAALGALVVGATWFGWQYFANRTSRDPIGQNERSLQAKELAASAVTQDDRDALAIRLDDIRRDAERLDAELRQPVPPPPNDVGDALLRHVRQGLDHLERELTPRP